VYGDGEITCRDRMGMGQKVCGDGEDLPVAGWG